MSGRVVLPPGRLKGRAKRLGHPELLGVLLIGGIIKVGRGRHLGEVVLLGLL